MKPVSAATAPRRKALARRDADTWRERSARLYREFERPARAMVKRGFRGAFGEDELDDIYSNAWVGTLRALEARHAKLTDEEIRSYLFTAVAHQAGREIRRRRRKPTAPLELVDTTPDTASGPEESAADAERSRVTRDLLVSLPPRRRAVMLLRYGWGLEPQQVCALVKGLSPRAYRKEVTRGVDELAEKVRSFERGEWCSEREPVLKAYAAGLADSEVERQAQAHLSHCRECAEFVARLNGHLHDFGGALAGSVALDGLDGHVGLADRIGDLGERARDAVGGVLGRHGTGAEEIAATASSSGLGRGAGAAGAGVLAKLSALGTASKAALACVGGGAAASACIAAGVAPVGLPGLGEDRKDGAPQAQTVDAENGEAGAAAPVPETLPSQVSAVDGTASPPAVDGSQSGDEDAQAPESEPAPAPTPVDPATPASDQEFGAPSAAAPSPSSSTGGSSGADVGTSGSGGGTSAVDKEFGL